ncbi:acyl-CoA dehydrogenase family protein [Candidatus Binatus sp.]|uniref:acyl-CoA dehydrogenase family protein n=1 Tax=Candidatus Binatus sp. TaxID=2811406 RepID=UPI003BB0DB3C
MSLVEEAKRIAPMLAANAAEDDELRRLSDSTWKLLLDGGFLRSLQPARFGGGEVSLVEFVDATIEISRASPSAGWVAGVIGVHPWQLGLFTEKAQQEMWRDDPATMHSSSYNPTGKAEKVAGGYKLSGRWSFSTGCDHCRGVMLGAISGTREIAGNQVRDFRSFLLMRDQYRIEDNWHVAGLRGTGSKDITVEETFVPEYRTQSHLDYAMNASLPGQDLNKGPLFRLPWSVVFNMAIAASALGSARGFVDAWIGGKRDRKLNSGGRAADDSLIQNRLAEALWYLDATVSRVRADAIELRQMAEAHEAVSMQQRAQMRWNMNRGCDLIGQAVTDLFRAASGRAIFLDHPLQRRFQDMQAALAHAYLVPDPLAKAVGGMILGATKQEMVL